MNQICATTLLVLWLGALAVKTLPAEAVAAAEPQAPAFDIAPLAPQDGWLASAPTAEDRTVLASHHAGPQSQAASPMPLDLNN